APATTSLPQPKPLPTIPAQQPIIMSTSTPFHMPVRGTNQAPKFDGTTPQLRDFLETFDASANDAGLLGNDRIKQILRYLSSDDRELWSGLPEASLSDYDAFIKEVKDMYPGWEGDRRYTVADLQAVAQKHANEPMTWRDEFSVYDRAFRKVMQQLMNKGIVGTAERDRIFLEGAVTKREYPRPTTPQFEGCIFCGASDHYIGRCSECAKYLEAGKCKRDDSNKLVLPNGNRIFGPEPTLKEKIDRFLESEKNTPMHSVQAGKSVRFDGVDVPSEPRARPAPASRQATVEEELVSPAIQASSNKGKANTSTPAHAVPAPPPTGTYCLSCALEDKGAEKRITDQILDITIQVPVRDIFAVSPDIRKNFRDMSSNKRVTVGTVSVNELSSHPANRDWMRQYDGSHMRSDDGRIVANHYAALRCIRASTVGGRILTCVLDQGAEVVVMPKDVWQSLGVGLRSDHRLNMESVNTMRNSTLGVIENIPLDFGGGPMFFQAQVTERANFEILLGHPFFTLTSCRTFDLPDGEQDIVITDPNTGKEMRIPTLPWVKNCQSATHGAPCIEGAHSHVRANVSQVNGQGFKFR
ncbi:hypothetical protein P692DRAFT_201715678, partial [Suillus brevipes Sb2]